MFYNMDKFKALMTITVDLTGALTTGDRYRHLLEVIGSVIPCDCAALLRLEGDGLVPAAARGLTSDALGRRFLRREHPRLDLICRSREPLRFTADNPLPDPFDGLILAGHPAVDRIHACLGCPLYVDGTLIGALTADAFEPSAFDNLDQDFLMAVSSVAAAQMRIAGLMDALEKNAQRQGLIASDLMRDIQLRQGTQLIGTSPEMMHLKREIELVARSDFTVLVLGETGVGKELVVRAIHAASDRGDRPLLYLNCAALPETLADSELFGHTRGAFTGASRERTGKFELADGGTLFLDEIGEMPSALQPKLLRAIQEGEVQRVGSNQTIRVDVRLLAATNRDLEREVRAKRFREDLFHRLNVYPITVPPLRQRRQDIPLLAGHFCELTGRRLGLQSVRFSAESLEALTRYPWPGNVRELENVISRAILKAAGQSPQEEPIVVRPAHMGSDLATSSSMNRPPESTQSALPETVRSMRDAVADFQRNLIRQTVTRRDGNWAAAARDLGMHRSNLHHLAARLGLR
jgi:anaerobic nitric oxide reductase transcription regulator